MVRGAAEPVLEGGWFDGLSPIQGIGKHCLPHKISKSLIDLPVLLCGPAGTGKKFLLKGAADDSNIELMIFDISEICVDVRNGNGKQIDCMGHKLRHDLLEKVIRQFSGQERSIVNNKKTLLALYGADRLDDAGVTFAIKFKIVLIATEQINYFLELQRTRRA